MLTGLLRDDRRRVRISDADRGLAEAVLRMGLDDGRIALHEYESRLEMVLAAVYASDLRAPLAELPDADDVVRSAGGTSGAEPTVLRVGAAGLRRSGGWVVPARLQLRGGMGSVHLDFCKAEIRQSVTEIEIRLGTGAAMFLVPDGATANVDGVASTMGSVTSDVPAQQGPVGPHFVVTGQTRVGSISVVRRRKFAGIWF